MFFLNAVTEVHTFSLSGKLGFIVINQLKLVVSTTLCSRIMERTVPFQNLAVKGGKSVVVEVFT